jgi:hypothetical protein
MLVLCDGMNRSGSTWSFNVVLRLLRSCDPDRRTFGIYSEDPAVIAAAAGPRSSHVVVKRHTLDPSTSELCRTGAIKAIYTWRDPYDVVVSASRMFGFPLELSIAYLQECLRVWSFHRETNSACIVSYDTIMKRPLAGISSIAAHLAIPAEPKLVSQIAEEVSFRNVKRFSQHVDRLDPQRIVRGNGTVYDRETLLHQNHIRHGGAGYGIKSLNERQLCSIDGLLQESGFAFLCRPSRSTTPLWATASAGEA